MINDSKNINIIVSVLVAVSVARGAPVVNIGDMPAAANGRPATAPSLSAQQPLYEPLHEDRLCQTVGGRSRNQDRLRGQLPGSYIIDQNRQIRRLPYPQVNSEISCFPSACRACALQPPAYALTHPNSGSRPYQPVSGRDLINTGTDCDGVNYWTYRDKGGQSEPASSLSPFILPALHSHQDIRYLPTAAVINTVPNLPVPDTKDTQTTEITDRDNTEVSKVKIEDNSEVKIEDNGENHTCSLSNLCGCGWFCAWVCAWLARIIY